MTYKFKHSATIEQYLSNEMTSTERINFEQELEFNSALVKELKLSQKIDSALLRDDIIDMRQKLIATMHAGHEVKMGVPVVKMRSRKWWYVAASLATLIAIITTVSLQRPRAISNDALFAEYYNSENIADQTRSNENIVEAVVKFQQRDFRTASVLFKRILDSDTSNIAVWFYYGISNIETGNYDNSIKAFTVIMNQNDNLYIEHAEWYLGLCYLKNNQKAKAIEQFDIVASDPDNFHQQEAKSIIEKLLAK